MAAAAEVERCAGRLEHVRAELAACKEAKAARVCAWAGMWSGGRALVATALEHWSWCVDARQLLLRALLRANLALVTRCAQDAATLKSARCEGELEEMRTDLAAQQAACKAAKAALVGCIMTRRLEGVVIRSRPGSHLTVPHANRHCAELSCWIS